MCSDESSKAGLEEFFKVSPEECSDRGPDEFFEVSSEEVSEEDGSNE